MFQWHGESWQEQDRSLGTITMAAGSPSLRLRFAEHTDFPLSAVTSKLIEGRESPGRQTLSLTGSAT